MNLKSLRRLDKDDLLNFIGLQTKRDMVNWVMPAIGIFSVGLLVGAGVGLLLAPKPGRELREDLRGRLQGVSEDVAGTIANATSGVTAQRQARSF